MNKQPFQVLPSIAIEQLILGLSFGTGTQSDTAEKPVIKQATSPVALIINSEKNFSTACD